jgi:5-aminolevulinate synthase
MTFPYSDYLQNKLRELQNEGRYRTFTPLLRNVDSFPVVELLGEEKRSVTVWCSNDYLGMGHRRQILDRMCTVLNKHGAGAGGTRNISGNHTFLIQLESELADLHQKEAALVFTSGYVANETALSTIGSLLPECVIFSDSKNHASMIEGIRHSKGEKRIFPHNSVRDLEHLLQQVPLERPKLIAFESVYSMDGDFSPLSEICDLAEQYGAMTYLDETHAVGLYGNRGGGLAERAGVLERITVLQGGLGKAFGMVGGFITGSRELIDCVRSYGAGFIFTTSLPPALAAGATESIRHLKRSSDERTKLHERVESTRKALSNAGLPVLSTESHIIPVIVGNSALCRQISHYLLDKHSIYVQPINYPTVARGTERLRITPTPLHSNQMISDLQSALVDTWQTFELPFRSSLPVNEEYDAPLSQAGNV